MQRLTAAVAATLGERRLWQWLLPALYCGAASSLLWMTVAEAVVLSGTTWVRTAEVIVQGLGLAFVMAFASLRCQLLGLCGPVGGILPVGAFCDELKEAHAAGLNRRRVVLRRLERHADDPELRARMLALLPPRVDLRLTVQRAILATWRVVGTSERSLLSLCDAGLACGLMLLLAPPCLGATALRHAQRLALAVAWWAYLVTKRLCREFLNLQWDALLLEMAVLAWPLSFYGVLPSSLPPIIWGVQLLLFRLIFSSGVCKLRSGCPHWRNLTAMMLHYETQPLPHMLSWFAHGLPAPLQRLSAFACLVIELPVPLLIFAAALPLIGVSCRLIAFASISGLMLLIGMTGNYGFFNALMVVLALSLLPDQQLEAVGLGPVQTTAAGASGAADPLGAEVDIASAMTVSTAALWANPTALLQGVHLVLCFTMGPVLGLAASVPLCNIGRFGSTPWELPAFIRQAHTLLAPLGIGKSYGLFASMTTFRWEIVLEGSLTGAPDSWKEFALPNKPSSVKHHPVWVWPGHLPRLDWLLWFVPLRMARGGALPEWLERFVFLLLCGADLRATRDLLAANPFADAEASHGGAPRFVRISLYDYHLSNCDHSREPGAQPERDALRHHCATYNLNRKSDSARASKAGVNHDSGEHAGETCGAEWQGDQEAGAWWRRQLVTEVGCFALAEGRDSEGSAVAARESGAALTASERMAAYTLEKVAPP